MSGTSMDGLDCGLFKISLTPDNQLQWSCNKFTTFPYSLEINKSIRSALNGNEEIINKTHNLLGMEISKYSEKFLNGAKVDLIAHHGQTIAHTDGKNTRQIGNVRYLQKNIHVPITYNFRHADIKNGGNGAPLMPFLDWLLFKDICLDTITLNIGGIANVTFISKTGKRDEVVGFDTGPGMALIDECCQYYFNKPFDKDGKYSAQGVINEQLLAYLMTNDFILKRPPKSSGRHEFGKNYIKELNYNYSQISPVDMIRTLCAFTSKSIIENINKYINFTSPDYRLFVSGGGVNHPVLMDDLKNISKIKNINTSNQIGINPGMKESLLMAVLGVARLLKVPANMPSVTGAKKLAVLGELIN
tara:strand:+ start:712 stop:1788 length:1077 start_codon:yes stop_codon:yes gene_type:complete